MKTGIKGSVLRGIAVLLLLSSCSGSGVPVPGSAAPDFRLETFDGRRFYLNGHKGSVVLLGFWAPWCKICKEELIELNAVYGSYADRGLVVAGIDIEGTDRAGAGNMVREYGIKYPVLMDRKGGVKAAYGAAAVPYTVLIGRKQKVRAVYRGFGRGDLPAIREKIEELLSEDEQARK